MSAFPLFLDLRGRSVVVVGGGPIGARKAAELLDAGANVRVVTLHRSEEVDALGARIHVESRAFVEADLDGAFLVVAATSDPDTQSRVFAAAEARALFCLAVDDPKNASAAGAAILRRGGITVAISSGGEAPALVRLVRELVEAMLPRETWIQSARLWRAAWKRDKTKIEERFPELVRAFADGRLTPPPRARSEELLDPPEPPADR